MEQQELEKLAKEYSELFLSWVLKELSLTWEENILFHKIVGDHTKVKLDNMALPEVIRNTILDHMRIPR